MSGSSKQIMIHAPRWQGDGCAYTRALGVLLLLYHRVSDKLFLFFVY